MRLRQTRSRFVFQSAVSALAVGLLGFGSHRASAQAVPFFAAGATSFSPEIGVVNSGIVSDVQATVSADRRYVTLNMRQQNTELLAIREFQFQQGAVNGAFAGNVGGAGAAEAAAASANNPSVKSSSKKLPDPRIARKDASDADMRGARAALEPPSARSSTPNPLDRIGMTRIDQIDNVGHRERPSAK